MAKVVVITGASSGIGLSHAVFLAQKGLDPALWPKKFTNYLPNFPKGIEVL